MLVMEGGNDLHHVKRERDLSGRGKCPGEYVHGKYPDPFSFTVRNRKQLLKSENNELTTCDFSTVAVWRSHMALTSIPRDFS